MKNILKIIPFIVLFLFLNTCEKNPAEWANNPYGNEPGVTDAYIDLEETGAMLESYNTADSTVVYNFLGRIPDFEIGSVIIIDADTTGYLRMVKNISIDNNKAILETERAYLTDVFMNTSFKLETSMIEPSKVLSRTSTQLEISEALTDKDGFIHPVEVFYDSPNNIKVRKSVFDFVSAFEDTTISLINKNFSNTDIYGNAGDNLHLFISKGQFKFNPNAIFKLTFDEKEIDKYIDGKKKKIKKGDLKYFECSMGGFAEFDVKFGLELKKSPEFNY